MIPHDFYTVIKQNITKLANELKLSHDYDIVFYTERILSKDKDEYIICAKSDEGVLGSAYIHGKPIFESLTLGEVKGLNPSKRVNRAYLIATFNMLMRMAGKIDKSRHCSMDAPSKSMCIGELMRWIEEKRQEGAERIGLVGLKWNFFRELRKFGDNFRCLCRVWEGIRVLDRTIEGRSKMPDLVKWADAIIITSAGFSSYWRDYFVLDPAKPILFYGPTGAGVCKLFNLPWHCPAGL